MRTRVCLRGGVFVGVEMHLVHQLAVSGPV